MHVVLYTNEGEQTREFDTSVSLALAAFWAEDELGASPEIAPWAESVMISWFSVLSNERNMSTNESGFVWSLTEDESSLNTSVKHSVTTSRPSTSTPGAGSTVLEKTYHHQKQNIKAKTENLYIYIYIIPNVTLSNMTLNIFLLDANFDISTVRLDYFFFLYSLLLAKFQNDRRLITISSNKY